MLFLFVLQFIALIVAFSYAAHTAVALINALSHVVARFSIPARS